MKLIILHLSDMHFSKKNSYQPVNIDAKNHCTGIGPVHG